jgi:hypothetical protein
LPACIRFSRYFYLGGPNLSPENSRGLPDGPADGLEIWRKPLMMEQRYVYFENLDRLDQEVIIDLFVSIIEMKEKRQTKEERDETNSNLYEVQ